MTEWPDYFEAAEDSNGKVVGYCIFPEFSALFIKYKPLYDFKIYCLEDCDLHTVSFAIMSELKEQFPKDFMCLEKVAVVRFKRLFGTKKKIGINSKNLKNEKRSEQFYIYVCREYYRNTPLVRTRVYSTCYS